MPISHAKSGEVVQVRLGAALRGTKTRTLVKTNDLKVIRLFIPAGEESSTHTSPGELTVQCLEGRVLFIAHGKSRELGAGQFVYLAPDEPHSLKAIEDSSLLVTIHLALKKPVQKCDIVE